MARIKDKNINTKEWWDADHTNGAPHNINIWEQFRRFFDLGYLPTDEEVSVLDVGCGQALHVPQCFLKFPKVKLSGLDLSTVVTVKNRQLAPFTEFFDMDIEKDPMPGVYDYVVSMHTFEHFSDPAAVLEKCKLAARKKVIIIVPYDHYWNDDKTHVHKFTLDDPFTDFVKHEIINTQELLLVFEGKANG